MAFLVSITNSAIPLLVALFAGLYYGGNIARYGLYSAIIHEFGHILAFYIIKRELPKLKFKAGGVSIILPNASRLKTTIMLSAGVVANLIAVLVCIFISLYKPSYNCYFILFANLIIAIFNILPFSFSDGGRLLELYMPARFLAILDHVFAINSAILIATLFYMILINGSMVLQISLIGIIIIITIKIWIDYNDKKGT